MTRRKIIAQVCVDGLIWLCLLAVWKLSPDASTIPYYLLWGLCLFAFIMSLFCLMSGPSVKGAIRTIKFMQTANKDWDQQAYLKNMADERSGSWKAYHWLSTCCEALAMYAVGMGAAPYLYIAAAIIAYYGKDNIVKAASEMGLQKDDSRNEAKP